jgi:peptidoglycan/xylan/chitin deacetylase (PgdA/CDA1 family)
MAEHWTCLMYHDVVTEPVRRNGGPERFAVPLRAFQHQLDWITAHSLRGCSIEEALTSPSACVAISFDDGDAGQYRHAFPALVARGMSATFFITTSWVGQAGHVTWDQLREMRAAGMSIQSHTRTHPFLSELDAAELRDELLGSRIELDEKLGQTTGTLALPGGDEPRSRLRHVIEEAGYRAIATSRWGVNGQVREAPGAPRRVRRCTVMGEPSRERFRRILMGDAWLLRWQGARGIALATARARLGPRRYEWLRRRLLDSVGARA